MKDERRTSSKIEEKLDVLLDICFLEMGEHMDRNFFLENCISDKLYQEIVRTTNDSVLKTQEYCSNKTFLITGANGFIAYYLVLTILNSNDMLHRNNRVVLLVRSKEKAQNRYGKILDRDDVSLLIQDVCVPLPDMGRVDYVIHAASAADAQHFDADPIGVFNSNVIGTENIIQFVNQNACESAVYISSFTIYGQGTDKLKLIDESFCGAEPWNNNRACYSYGKRSAEFLCMAAARKQGSPVKIVRPGFVYGASHINDTRVYSEIIRCVAENRPIVLQSAGLLYRSMIYVTDLVTAILAVLLNGKNGEPYNVANEHVSIRQFAEAAVQSAASKDVYIRYANEKDAAMEIPTEVFGAMAIEKIGAECGWMPHINLLDGISASAGIILEM